MATASKETFYATGRRKEASARVFVTSADSEEEALITVNGRELNDYFPHETLRMIINQPLDLTERKGKYVFRVTVRGGGMTGQAGAVRHGISRALERAEGDLRPVLKKGGFLTRDSRQVERKKPGRHKARKKPQFSKR